ncbi:hypothetical protein [Paenibacillus sp. JDR-2]|uniref:hypothetical protein n=1 Tax=Paenibacillus sp. (strain JDR-2) TaxID=324057 RepID=UPI0001668C93|nr:hypothetical protein [Paenibacillus sp. JDR-2]ACT03324.1 hypothetical protein Pjdr2_4710 [Paenibacillus sp. JDR-2]
MTDNYHKIIYLLEELRARVESPLTDLFWSSYNSVSEILEEIDSYVIRLTAMDIEVMKDIQFFIAPTGSMQEISISNGWASEFVAISGMLDQLMEFSNPV